MAREENKFRRRTREALKVPQRVPCKSLNQDCGLERNRFPPYYSFDKDAVTASKGKTWTLLRYLVSYSVKIVIHNNILVHSLMAVYLPFIFSSAILYHSRVTRSKPNTVLPKEATGPEFWAFHECFMRIYARFVSKRETSPRKDRNTNANTSVVCLSMTIQALYVRACGFSVQRSYFKT